MGMQTDDTLFSLGDVGTKVLYLISEAVGRSDLHGSRQVLHQADCKSAIRIGSSSRNRLTYEDDSLLIPAIGKYTLLSSQPGLLDSFAHLYSESGFGLRKGFGRVLESEICAVLSIVKKSS
jgi:hypothetical protein